ncbi:exodeoxyribonuclease V subunit beta [Rubrivivax rivuli]|uniref:RecBCD enzyme subunit RecB n=1 Tax=Rubrivivax rivuli TaxID=1862385 RepID=A0A437RII7_9BURK|nr:exodeoxyribonuclease V subunit beta [Rubrivivax rivuli]RVU46525.1 exodeoxyribonuclease V subunit beta [Rubrivivax rivuli]
MSELPNPAAAQLLNPLTLPLQGSRLIEASAGTGKTWTIAALYLRLVLGHGGAAAAPVRPLLPGEILVMSFTKAATRELSDRIRARLVEAAASFRGEPRPPDAPAPDAFLTALLAEHAAGPVREQAAWRLAMAAEAMDDAAVFTIDAWCQRMLREHAFDSGSLFDEELQADEAALREQAAHDYWRQQVYPLADEALAAVLGTWADVEALVHDVQGLLQRPLAHAVPAGSLGEAAMRLLAERRAVLARLKAGWVERVEAMERWLVERLAPRDSVFNRNKLREQYYAPWLAALTRWAQDPEAATIEGLNDTGRLRLTPAGLQAACKEGASVDPPPEFAAFETLLAALEALPPIGPALRAHAVAHIGQRLAQLKAQGGRFGFADLLQRLDAALDTTRHGERALRLRERILAQHPVALIDEFQDTSPLQLRIFDRLYRIAQTPPSQALLLIGDPKQAIYAFRGADIHSYLQARRATAGRHHVLGTNHRSSMALVAAVNACFAQAEARPGEGAFLLRGELPFLPVAARGRAERWVSAAGDEAPLLLCLSEDLQGGAAHLQRYAALCAEHIVQRLNDAACGFVGQGGAFQPLRPADIAVLVRSGREAAAVRAALQARGVASVYLSDQDSVFASDEAADLLRLLHAVAAPRDTRLARAALATALLALPLPELLQLAHDDSAFDARCATLAELQRVWQQQGVLAMLRRALHAFALPARWLAGTIPGALPDAASGERRLTNVLHLAELLQAASSTVEGEPALLRWLALQIDEAQAGRGGAAGDEQVLRLESDADLVQVITVHKSKGLEYPLVCLPFAAQARPETGRGGVNVAAEDGQRLWQLAPSSEQVQAAEAERLREDTRLLYVALTRARHQLWLGVAPLTRGNGKACQWHLSALGRLVSGAAERTAEAMVADVRQFFALVPGAQLLAPALQPETGLPPRTRLAPRTAAAPLRPAPRYSARFDRLWAVSSYSALVRDAAPVAPALQAATAAVPRLLPTAEALPLSTFLLDDEPAEAEATAAVSPAAGPPARGVADTPWHRFPRGALAGNFLHGQLEWLAGEGFALDTQPALQQALQRRCERQGWGHRADDVLAWLRAVCSRPLPPLGVPLAGLSRCLPEMEFWLPSTGLHTGEIDRLCRQHLLPGRARPALAERQLHGLLMGFADLVYEQDGRFGVLDHKSNALGGFDADYTPFAMEEAMLAHRYDVQAALYLLALHRLLRARLGAAYRPAYRPAEQLHGAVYLFLRGIHSESAGALHLAPPLALLQALDEAIPQGAGA